MSPKGDDTCFSNIQSLVRIVEMSYDSENPSCLQKKKETHSEDSSFKVKC